MDFNEYQKLSKRTMPKGDLKWMLANYMSGLAGESGETVDLLKKFIFHDHDLNTAEVKYELGDILHYLSGIAAMLGISLDEVAEGNIEKLRNRYPEGFNSEDSKKRVDVHGS